MTSHTYIFHQTYSRILKIARLAILLGVVGLSQIGALSAQQLSAEQLYQSQRNEEAAQLLASEASDQTLEQEDRALRWYQAGNAYYAAEQWGRAILSYRRALYIAPDFSEARHNLGLAQSARMYMASMSHPILREQADRWSYALSLSWWSVVTIIMFVLALVAFTLFLLGRGRKKRRRAFYLSMLFVALWCVGVLTIFHRKHYDREPSMAVLCGVRTPLYATDATEDSEPLMQLYDGAEMYLRGTTSERSDGRLPVKLPDGTEGLVSATAIVLIQENQDK